MIQEVRAEVTAIKAMTATILKKSRVANTTWEFTLGLGQRVLPFVPGQYIWLELAHLVRPDPRGNRRAFSICSAPAQNPAETHQISIVLRGSPSGYKKTLLGLKPGAKVKVQGPFGSFVLPAKKPVVLICGGVGIAPFMSMLRSEAKQRSLWLINFNSSEQRSPYLDELTQLAKRLPGFRLNNYVDGFSVAKLRRALKSQKGLARVHWFVTGPAGLVDAAAQVLKDLKVPLNRISFDENYPTVQSGRRSQSSEYLVQPEMFEQAVRDTSNHIIFTDPNGHIKFANESAQRLTGYSFAEMRDQTPRLWGGLMEPKFYQELWHAIKDKKQPHVRKIRNRRKDGSDYFALARISPILGKKGQVVGFVGTEEDITELERIDRAKSEFVSLASHQLGTPLTTIKWSAETLLSRPTGNLSAAQRSYIRAIYASSKHLTDLVHALLNVSRLELGSLDIAPKQINACAIVTDVLSEYKRAVKRKRLHLQTLCPRKALTIFADPTLIRIVFSNLISNAIKYTPARGHVTVRLRRLRRGRTERIVFSVTDTGYGIPRSQQANVFNKLFRADNILEKDVRGTGLGLYITKSIVDIAKGKIWFDSKLNVGSSFYVALPPHGMVKKGGTKILIQGVA